LADNSLALLSDAVHMLTDVAALSLGLFALWVAHRPPSANKTFGYHRAEILAALANGVALCVVVILIVGEAIDRLRRERVDTTACWSSPGRVGHQPAVRLLLAPRGQQPESVRRFYVIADVLGRRRGRRGADHHRHRLVRRRRGGRVRDRRAGADQRPGPGAESPTLMEAVPSHIDATACAARWSACPACAASTTCTCGRSPPGATPSPRTR
jgi:hypothetical protein